MRTYLTETKVEPTEDGVRITLSSPAGDYTFDARAILTQELIDKLINGMYFDKMTEGDQLSFDWNEDE